ncbi:MerR family transcriptional regulator [Paenibacillus hexagrammi]|uniref:MerR family transcriptional regulator n=1 Tax=Paenibacillus hexagrammi TaxID=2908839 RepID=A0ABY3SEX4_9BACL|nr:MerR family transcriptional regulator [Paenibacillus sp. YPD9-1]UJF32010.1 MerR family transcriptional regulator [Paenibacillus sp. YPD9-1]
MFIRDVEELTGLSSHTIRYYEKLGLLPAVSRSASGVRQFTEADVRFLTFVASLKKTGMTLENIILFLQEGCLVERAKNGKIPARIVKERIELLDHHKKQLLQQQKELEALLAAVDVKTEYYEKLLQDPMIFADEA